LRPSAQSVHQLHSSPQIGPVHMAVPMIGLAYFPLLFLIPLLSLQCLAKAYLGRLAQAAVRGLIGLLVDTPLGGLLKIVWVVELVLCLECIRGALRLGSAGSSTAPDTLAFELHASKEGALVLGLNLVSMLVIQVLHKLQGEAIKLEQDRDVMKKQAQQQAIFASSLLAESKKVELGRVKLLADPEKYRASFARFPGDQLNGLRPEKEALCGEEGRVIALFGDRTATILFDDGRKFDFPFESIKAQLAVAAPIVPGRVRLLQDLRAYKASFARFEGDGLNGWSAEKERRAGTEAQVVRVFRDHTATIAFDDGSSLDFPFESIEEQLSTEDNKESKMPEKKEEEKQDEDESEVRKRG